MAIPVLEVNTVDLFAPVINQIAESEENNPQFPKCKRVVHDSLFSDKYS